ncbi:MAG: hypothetical protein RID53_22280 [Coleofasciculus sp. B1-GNL1-01]|uniref:hypothetical protein n=1 Tax=Coleofasciculus sp. B1-GNL1-01 TaxID=3068484 RepID=UPI0032F1B205
MTQKEPNKQITTQKAEAGRNATQIAGDYRSHNSYNILLPLIGILALGGIAGAVVFGMNHGGQTPQLEPPQSSPQLESPQP